MKYDLDQLLGSAEHEGLALRLKKAKYLWNIQDFFNDWLSRFTAQKRALPAAGCCSFACSLRSARLDCVNNRILHYRVLTLISPPLTVLARTPAPRFNVLILTSPLRALLSLLLLPITHNAAINISQRQLFSIIFSARDCFRIRMEIQPMFSSSRRQC